LNVLIVRIGAIGDVVMTLPAVDAARKLAPHVRVTWICGSLVEPLLDHLGVADELIVVDERALLAGRVPRRVGEVMKIWRRMSGRRFDLVVTMHADRRYRLVSAGVRARERRILSRTARRTIPIPGRYEGDEYARLVHGEDGPHVERVTLPRVEFPIPSGLHATDGHRQLVVLAPGGAKNVLRDDGLRRWPVEGYAYVAKSLLERGVRVAVTGGASDEWVRPDFAALPVIDLIGATNLLELGGTIGASDLLITHDTGPLHLAFLARTPALALFGPTRPSERLPAGVMCRVLWGGDHLACRPCYDGRSYAPCPSNVCLQSVSAERVAAEAAEMLAERAAASSS
jgi:heptosyltransferase-2